jgi:hypothetical protein
MQKLAESIDVVFRRESPAERDLYTSHTINVRITDRPWNLLRD